MSCPRFADAEESFAAPSCLEYPSIGSDTTVLLEGKGGCKRMEGIRNRAREVGNLSIDIQSMRRPTFVLLPVHDGH
jgi:hypothetical protein